MDWAAIAAETRRVGDPATAADICGAPRQAVMDAVTTAEAWDGDGAEPPAIVVLRARGEWLRDMVDTLTQRPERWQAIAWLAERAAPQSWSLVAALRPPRGSSDGDSGTPSPQWEPFDAEAIRAALADRD